MPFLPSRNCSLKKDNLLCTRRRSVSVRLRLCSSTSVPRNCCTSALLSDALDGRLSLDKSIVTDYIRWRSYVIEKIYIVSVGEMRDDLSGGSLILGWGRCDNCGVLNFSHWEMKGNRPTYIDIAVMSGICLMPHCVCVLGSSGETTRTVHCRRLLIWKCYVSPD